MTMLYPLRFRPLFRRYLWGGRRLATVLNKPLGEGDDYAESWEVVDHDADQSVVDAGPLVGTTLHELVQEASLPLFGPNRPWDHFPLLFKFLDAHRDLSVQVHPNDQQAAGQTLPDLGKTEAWVVLDAQPGSRLYAGLKAGVDRASLDRAVAQGDTEHCLHRIEPRAGDCIFVPAGTLHALGAGLLVAEIQQSSDTTFRLFDWNRVDAGGKRRTLHIEQALATIDFRCGPVRPQTPQPTDRAHVHRLVDCDKFVLDRWHFDAPTPLVTPTSATGFHLLALLSGAVHVSGDPSEQPLVTGQTLLIPAAVVPQTRLRPLGAATMLDIYVL